ncbi:MAG: acyl-CoA dehydrogenase family protein [Microbacteriaceae bacterium]|nr:acyl-CoA dehydrogenase family protein [Microbacteriaceae bacterium]
MLRDAVTHTIACSDDLDATLAFARQLGTATPSPGHGRTLQLWQTLASVAAVDLTVARIVEPHLDALAILREAREGALATPSSVWGVFAAESAGVELTAAETDDGWRLSGTKPWCSLAGRLSHALVTARLADGHRRLFAVDLTDEGIVVRPDAWAARGLTEVPSGPVDFDRVDARPVGAAGWYLSRAGFAWGGIGVAAIWWGGTLGIARTLDHSTRERRADQIALMQLGAVDVLIETGRLALAYAAAVVDATGIDAEQPERAGILALRTRSIVAGSAEQVIARAGHALGPAPLALNASHARRVADLQLYLRQHHAERDEAALGTALLESGLPTW